MGAGPSSDPMAANSFTSPAPVAPNRWPGSMSARPTKNPRAAAPTVRWPIPAAANPRPLSASRPVSAFGTRRVLRSTNAAAATPAASVPITMKSDDLTNGAPEHVVNRLANRGDADDGDERYQRRQQPVFEQVLAVGFASRTRDCRDQPLHVHPPSSKRGAGCPGPAPRRSRSSVHYADGASAEAMRPKMSFTFVPASPMAPTHTSAMSAISSAYSSRS